MANEQVLPERNALIFERSIDINGLEQPGTAVVGLWGVTRGPSFYRSGGALLGISGVPAHVSASGLDAIRCQSQAGAQGISFSQFQIPLQKNPALMPVTYRTRRTYVFEAAISVLPVGATPFAMGIHPGINDLNAATTWGVEWYAATGVNAGRYTVRYRRTDAPTVITNVADSGVAADGTIRRLGIAFRESDIAVDFYLDGTLVTTITDPVSIGSSATVYDMTLSISTPAGVAGTDVFIFDARVRVFDPDFALYASTFVGQTPGS